MAGLIGVLSFHTRPAQQAPLSASGVQGAGGHSGGAQASPSARATAGVGNDGGSVRSALGPDVQFGYDVLDVKVTVKGTRITDISVRSLQTAEPTSQQISEQAIPYCAGRCWRPRAPASTRSAAPPTPARPTRTPCKPPWTGCTSDEPVSRPEAHRVGFPPERIVANGVRRPARCLDRLLSQEAMLIDADGQEELEGIEWRAGGATGSGVCPACP